VVLISNTSNPHQMTRNQKYSRKEFLKAQTGQDALKNYLEPSRKATGIYLRHMQMARYWATGSGDHVAAQGWQQTHLFQMRRAEGRLRYIAYQMFGGKFYGYLGLISMMSGNGILRIRLYPMFSMISSLGFKLSSKSLGELSSGILETHSGA